MRVLLTAINSKYIHTGLGLRYVGEYAKLQGYQVQLLEETINSNIFPTMYKYSIAFCNVTTCYIKFECHIMF